MWVLISAGERWGTFPSEQAATSTIISRSTRAATLATRLGSFQIEQRGNVCPSCPSCHNACHVVPGYEAAKGAELRAYEFGLAHAELQG